MLLNLLKFIFRTYFRVFYKVEVIGLDNIPQTGAVILTCNHVSNFDPPLVGGFVGLRRDPIYIIKKELASVPIVGPVLKSFGFIAIDRYRKGGDLHSLKQALQVIKKGKALFIFPEGTRSKTGKPIKPKAGIGFLLWHCQAPVIPIRVFNTEKLPFTRNLKIVIGKPFMPKMQEGKQTKEQFQDIADQVMQQIIKLK
ncbi:MAG: 1-acyl-sn-glycerol-3-phosphate acyltransferase [Elusimicrobiaceae bacterium]|nr:1-acyl-sn-glycerol-3-phosphate acyltransferase [Elusimicrobiaceae bacterium]